MSDQYKGPIRQGFAWWDAGGTDIPNGTYAMINEKFKAWEERRGFRSEDAGGVFDPKKAEPVKPLRGNALRAKLALESKKRVLAEEALKQAKKAQKKGLKGSKSSTKFAPDIVGKRYSTNNNAQRRIKRYILDNHLIIPADYEFKVSKVDWGCYEIVGARKQAKKA